MQTITRVFFLLISMIIQVSNVEASNDIVFLDRVLMNNSLLSDSLNSLLPNQSIHVFGSSDKIIYYAANIGVINPTKKKYDIQIICMDLKGNIVIRGDVKRSLSDFMYVLDGEHIKGFTQTLGLDPKTDALVKGQSLALKAGKDYFIKLYVEKKLIGVTRFHYTLDK